MYNQSLSNIDKTKLEGRIYPAIQSCVGNRYKIILGIFAYYGFMLLQSDKSWFLNIGCRIHVLNLAASFIFTLFVIHNTANYFANASEQKEIEFTCGENEKLQGKDHCYKLGRFIQDKVPIEICSFIVILILIWLAFIFITCAIIPKLHTPHSSYNNREIRPNFEMTCDSHY
ncbi:MAG: hypothetical protein OEW48_09625 [Phycisphaerae bacterium]|nr:hypothetical protein [Phycisphaerae bacterium]